MSATNKKSCFLLQFFDCNCIQEKRRYNKRKYEKREKKFMKNKLRKTNSGITLIALVITIIVLLILAGVTIATLTGENGILTKATEAKEETSLADEKEKVKLSATGALTKENGGEIIQSVLEEELGKYFTDKKYAVKSGVNEDEKDGYIVTITENDPKGRNYFVDKNGNVTEYEKKEIAEPTPGDAEKFIMKYGVIEVEFLEGKKYNTTNIPNPPIVKNELEAIKYDESGNPQVINDVENTEWYRYQPQNEVTENGGTSEWANAFIRDIDNNVEGYYVWIPRYAYRIIYFDSEDSENAYRAGTLAENDALKNNQIVGYSDARGIVDKEGRQVKEIAQQTAISVNDKYFKTHPAFEENVEYGGSGSKIEGIWVAKYEASVSDKESTIPKSIPNVEACVGKKIDDYYNYAKNYREELKSHLIKNSEWGATLYLADSKYGRNGTKIKVNDAENGNWEYITGNGDIVGSYLNSTTGNIYGIYDLAGGAAERVAAYYNKSTHSNLTNGKSFASRNGQSDSYSTAYETETLETGYKYGDALFETFNWNDDEYMGLSSFYPFFMRGADHSHRTDSGVFCIQHEQGVVDYGAGFRVCLILE